MPVNRKSKTIAYIVAAGALLALGASLGYIWHERQIIQQQSTLNKRVSAYPLIAKRALIDNPNDAILNFVPLRKILDQKFKDVSAPHSFSFEYLPTGTTIRESDTNELVGASMLKLPVVMDLYKAAELGKINLDKTVALEPDMLNDQYGTLYQRGAGAKLTLREAAHIALRQSDNTAILLIQHYINGLLTSDQDALASVDADYDTQGKSVLINSKSYASILKCLYFACYNNFASSEEILNNISQTADTSRITAQIPHTVTVAHKFGTNFETLTDGDCGIFYVPKRPYILCIMVGLPAGQAEQFESDISRIVYNAVINE